MADLFTERIEPVYQRYAEELGLGEEAISGLTARVDELQGLQRQIDLPLPRGGRSGTLAEAAPIVARRCRPARRGTTSASPTGRPSSCAC